MDEFASPRGRRLSDDPDSELSTVRLSSFGLRREPPRPPDDRHPGYERLFDFDTLFYDVFRSGDGRRVICLGPPLLNCEGALADATFRPANAKAPLTVDYRPPRSHLQPSCQILLSGEGLASARQISLELADQKVEIPIRPSGWTRFRGQRVVTTLSKDNPWDWIDDWIGFNIRVQGADAIMIYDNGSTTYTPGDLRRHLAHFDGLAEVMVIPWVFPYGPGVGPRNVQDSFFCQPGQLEHARRRYCGASRAVLNTDIDELIVTPPGESIFERAERSGRAAVVFPGIWVEKAGRSSRRPIRHTDCVYGRRIEALWRSLRRYDRLLRTKWIAIPDRCSEDMEWGVHDVYPVSADTRSEETVWKLRPRDIVYRHFRQITVGPKRNRRTVRPYSPWRHVFDRELVAALALAFPEQQDRPQTRRRRTMWRRGRRGG